MSNKKGNLTDKAGVVVFARIITTVIDLAIVIATIQILSKTDFAIIGYLLMIHEVARNLATLGFPESVFYYFERISGSAKRGFVAQTTVILLGTALISAVFILIVSYFAPDLLTEWDPFSVNQFRICCHGWPCLPFLKYPHGRLPIPCWRSINSVNRHGTRCSPA